MQTRLRFDTGNPKHAKTKLKLLLLFLSRLFLFSLNKSYLNRGPSWSGLGYYVSCGKSNRGL